MKSREVSAFIALMSRCTQVRIQRFSSVSMTGVRLAMRRIPNRAAVRGKRRADRGVQLPFSFAGPLIHARDGAKRNTMLSSLAGLMLAAAAPATYGPALPAPPKPAAKAPAAAPCKPPEIKQETTEIVVCAVKPNGYRLDPDVMQAKKRAKDRTGGPKKAEI